MTIPAKAVQIIRAYEGLDGLRGGLYYPYHCDADRPGLWTIGYGHLISTADLSSRRFAAGLSLSDVVALLYADMAARQPAFEKCGTFTDDQYAGGFSMFFNEEAAWVTGTPGLRHRKGDFKGAAESMLWYCRSNSAAQLGLWRRRMSEALLYLTGEVMIANDPASEKALNRQLAKLIQVVRPVALARKS